MPELPEVETISKQLDKELSGFRLDDVVSSTLKSYRPSFEKVRTLILGRKVIEVGRRSKLVLFKLSGGVFLAFHLKLTGQLLVRSLGFPEDKFVRSIFFLSKGKTRVELRFSDVRKFGYVQLIDGLPSLKQLLAKYGPEPLDGLNKTLFSRIVLASKKPIKQLLLDQERISGIGNIYANEALWYAKIDPRAKSNELSQKSISLLLTSLTKVLKLGIKYGGASDNNYVQIHGEKGHFQDHFSVYGRKGEFCKRRDGGQIKRIPLGGRGTFFCDKCQLLR